MGVKPLCRLLRRLARVINIKISVSSSDTSLPIPQEALPLKRTWLVEGLLSELVHGIPPLSNIRVTSDASDRGLRYQTDRDAISSFARGRRVDTCRLLVQRIISIKDLDLGVLPESCRY